MKRIFTYLMLILSVASTEYSLAVDDELYYQLGGGAPIARATSNRDDVIAVGAGVAWQSDLMCGNFDISLSIEQQLNGLAGAFENTMSNVIESATGAVASLPALAIQKLHPPLYDLLQNGILQASEEFHLAKTSCEGMIDYLDGSFGTDSWTNTAKGQALKEETQVNTNEILTTMTDIESTGGDGGVTWVGGTQRGGAAQAPMNIVQDTTKAGYNMLLNRAPENTTSTVATCGDAPICEIWPSPQGHADWVVEVIGDWERRTCNGCQRMTTQAGLGLARKIEADTDQIEEDLMSLVASLDPPSEAGLLEVSGGPSMRMSRRVIEAIRAERPEDQAGVIRRISGEMALNLNMERALMARRSLSAGRKEPNIANNELAQIDLERAVTELNTEIENLLFEMEVRQRIGGKSTTFLLRRDAARKVVPQGERQKGSTLKDGAIHD